MTPVERAAQALRALDLAEASSGISTNDERDGFYQTAVRAVLQALREPSEAMWQAGEQAVFDAVREERKWVAEIKEQTGGIPSYRSWQGTAAWQAMIDAALAE